MRALRSDGGRDGAVPVRADRLRVGVFRERNGFNKRKRPLDQTIVHSPGEGIDSHFLGTVSMG